MSLRVFVVGQKWLGAAVFWECVRLGHIVVGAASPPDDRLERAASDAGVSWGLDSRLAAGQVPDGTDLILAAHCHRYLPPALRAAARYGAVGYHPSLLPHYRGRHAVEDAVVDGAQVTGGSWYRLDDGWDTGIVLVQAAVPIPMGCDAPTLWRDHLAPLALRLLPDALRGAILSPRRVEAGT